MCNIEQCSRCRYNYVNCDYYDHTNDDVCGYYSQPEDNSKMFSRWYKFDGRIGRLEFGLTFLFSALLYVILLLSLVSIMESLHITDQVNYAAMHILCIIIPGYIMLAATVKRAHDAGKDLKRVLTPAATCIALLIFRGSPFITFFLALIIVWGFFIFYKSEEGINAYGANPSQSANSQIKDIEID